MLEKKLLDSLRTAINNASTIALCGHTSPDGDCIGSCIGLGLLLESLGKKVSYYTPTDISSYFSFVDKVSDFNTDRFDPKRFDCILCLDIANQERSNMDQYTISDFEGSIFVIDHHYSNSFSGCPVLLDKSKSSCCEIIVDIINHYDSSLITPTIATALLLGIMTDTGNFMRGYHPENAFRTAANLVDAGAEKSFLTKNLYQSNSFNTVRFIGTMIDRTTNHEDTVIWSYHIKSELDKLGLNSDQAEGGFHTIKSIKHDGAFILFKINDTHEKPFIKFSFRTGNPDIDVSIIASQFGGGGHKAAAAAKVFISGDWKEIIQHVVEITHNSIIKQRTNLSK